MASMADASGAAALLATARINDKVRGNSSVRSLRLNQRTDAGSANDRPGGTWRSVGDVPGRISKSGVNVTIRSRSLAITVRSPSNAGLALLRELIEARHTHHHAVEVRAVERQRKVRLRVTGNPRCWSASHC